MEAVSRAQEIRKRIGDEQSSLLDEFERMSFAAELNRAMLGRSLSEPGFPRSAANSSNSRSRVNVNPNIPPLLSYQVKQGRRRPSASAFHKLLKKLLKPVLGRKTKQQQNQQQQRASDLKHHHPLFCNTFSRSLRF